MLTLSSIASSTTRTGSISPAIACAARAPIRHPRIDRCATECKKLSASKAPDPGRHHVGTPGDIISECPGDFVGIRIQGLDGLLDLYKRLEKRGRALLLCLVCAETGWLIFVNAWLRLERAYLKLRLFLQV